MKKLMTLALLLAASVRADEPATAQDRMTDGKIAADRESWVEAEQLFAQVAGDASASEDMRCEAMVRRGDALRHLSRHEEAQAAFDAMTRDCSGDRSAMGLLLGLFSGVTPQEPGPIHVKVISVADGHGDVTYHLTSSENEVVPPWSKGPPYTGDPISISIKDGSLPDVLSLFTMFSGVPFIADESIRSRKVTLDLADVPWDQALADVVRLDGLVIERDGGGWRVKAAPGVTAPSAAP